MSSALPKTLAESSRVAPRRLAARLDGICPIMYSGDNAESKKARSPRLRWNCVTISCTSSGSAGRIDQSTK